MASDAPSSGIDRRALMYLAFLPALSGPLARIRIRASLVISFHDASRAGAIGVAVQA